MRDYSKAIQKHLDGLGWSWYKLAKESGLVTGTIYRIRDGKNFDQSTLDKIAESLGVQTWLLNKEAEEQSK